MRASRASEASPLRAPEQLSHLTETNVRHGFVQKVYGILLTQLLVTTLIGWQVMRVGEALVLKDPNLLMAILMGSGLVCMAVMCTFHCNRTLMQKSPHNYLLLALFTVAKAVLVGFISVQYTGESVLICLAITAFVVLGLTLFACQTTYDFTTMGPYFCAGCFVLCGFGFVLCLGAMLGLASSPAWTYFHLAYAAAGALLFSCLIVFNTQKIVGGKHAAKYTIDDYCMAAISLYHDIMQLFMFMLQLFGKRKH